MAQRRNRSGKQRPAERSKRTAASRTLSEGVTVKAVHASSGRSATMVQVEVDAERVKHQVRRFEKVDEVVAAFPNAADGEHVRWEDQRLEKTSEDVRPGGERTLRYSGTRYDACDAPEYGIGVRLRTPEGTLEAPPSGRVRESDKPGDDETAPVED